MKLGSTLFTIFFLACGGTSTSIGDGGSDGSSGDGSYPTDGGGTDSGGGDGSMSNCMAPSIDLTFANCPARPNCGGTIAPGNYYYTSGCISDPWARAKMLCPQLMVMSEKGTVKGCLAFTANFVSRDVAASYSATLDYPTSCLLGGSCMQLQTGLQMYFPMATCMQSTGGCTCNVSSSTYSQVGTGYTTMANQIVTTNNQRYDYCVNGMQIGIEWAMGGVAEPGVYNVTKQ